MKNPSLKKKKPDLFPYLMCLPAVVLFTMFVILPFIEGLRVSFYRWDGFSAMKWVGIRNYVNVIGDDVFWISMKNTFVYAVLVTVFKTSSPWRWPTSW